MNEQYSKYLKDKYQPKERFVERMEELLGKQEAKEFFEISYTQTPDSIRCNTLKISVNDLKKRLEGYGWKIKQPFKDFQEIMIIENDLEPGELGKTKEHLLGYYYVQEISSMLPMMVLRPSPSERILDLCASPGSKTTQAASMMENSGVIVANEVSMGRLGILSANLERCGVANVIVTKKDGFALCNNLWKKTAIRFDKILVDAPCSGEGTLRKSPKTFLMWNEDMIKKIAGIQKGLAEGAFKILKVGGEMIYSTCTLAPEENEFIINYLSSKFDLKVEKIELPLKTRSGVSYWMGEKLNDECKNCIRLYPQDNNTDGFFVAKLKKLSERGCEVLR